MKKTVLFLLLSTFVVCRLYSQSYQLIGVSSPAYCSEIEGNTTIEILAPGCPEVTISCWKQGDGFGANSVIGTVALDENGTGSIVFPADEYPHGPITIKISGEVVIIPPDIAILSDECDLQLYNKGGVSWNEGLPDTPPAAEGMTLVYADDFDGELSVGSDSKRFTYYDHKPPYGNQDFSSIPFTSAMSKEKNPFSQADSYLRIRADVNKNSSGLISSMFSNKSGFSATYPSYFECRFVGPKVPGSWPAFWLLSVPNAPYFGDNNEAVDELDIIEAYGANSTNHQYVCTPHAWNQASELQAICDRFYNTTGFVTMTNFGIPSTWYDTFHTYGLKITETETIYYCDNIEVGRHETLPVSKAKPFFFMINLATQGTDMAKNLARYDGIMDMYVDYVRVYSSAASSGINLPEKSDLDVSVFPNPVNSEAVVSFESPSLENISVNIFNVLGQPVFSKSIYEQGAVNIPVDMLSMNAGIYLMKIRAGGLQTTKTVIKI